MMEGRSLWKLLGVALLIVFATPVAQAQEMVPDRMPGTIRAVGTDFQITESDYFDVAIHSTSTIRLRAESIPGSVMLVVEADTPTPTTTITVDHLAPTTKYYRYIDDFQNLTEIMTDEHGSYSFTQDLHEPHIIFIQAHKSTVFLRDNATGGDCPRIGTWDAGTKTCFFTTDTSEVIQFASDGITLDGQGNTFTGWNVYAPLRSHITVKNLNFHNNQGTPVFFYATNDSLIENITSEEIRAGVAVTNSLRDTIRNCKITITEAGAAISLDSVDSITLINNILMSDVRGVSLRSAAGNVITENTISRFHPDGSVVFATPKGGMLLTWSKNNVVFGNRFIDYEVQAQVTGTSSSGNLFQQPLPIGGNTWSDFDTPAEGCNDANKDGFCDAPYVFTGGQDTLPKVGSVAGTISKPPTIAFIPGLEATRLEQDTNQLWEPNRNADVTKLFLDADGHSIESGIMTDGVIDEAYGFNVYKNFLTYLDTLTTEKTIQGWQALPYDWRFDAPSNVSAMIASLKALAPSDGGNITIITHSNGGIIAKSVLQELARQKERGESNLIDHIDQLIMVAAPQLGTPKTIGALLHGYDQEWLKGVILNTATARELGEHMKSAFALLPSASYFNTVLDPVVDFDVSANRFAPFTERYGGSIDSVSELKQFLTGDNGLRSEPASNDTVSPNVLGGNFVEEAVSQQDAQAAWTPPATIKVIQIAGWGLDTVRTFRYLAKRTFFCGDTSVVFCHDGYRLDYQPLFTSDGDETVVTPSAVAMNAKAYYVNLFEHNKELIAHLRRNREHADILEVQELQGLVRNILLDDNVLPKNITTSKPEPTDQTKKLRVSVHSPVSLGVYDADGNHTGLIPNPDPASDIQLKEEQIPNSYYFEAGEGKYVGFMADEPHAIKLHGTDTGTFTLDIGEVVGDQVTTEQSYNDIPVLPQTTAELTLQTVTDAGNLQIDLNGDGTNDFSLHDTTSLTPSVLLDMLSSLVQTGAMPQGAATSVQSQIKNAKKFIEKRQTTAALLQLQNIERTIQREAGKSISQSLAQTMLTVTGKIRVQL